MTSRIDIIGQNGGDGLHYDERATYRQVGGEHYVHMPIQPMELSMKNNLNACQHTAIKYLMRYKLKNGKEDLEKAKHVIDMLIEFEYGNE